MHEGHRQRMLERLESAEGSLQEHELLEILLFNAIPRKNTNELAHRLLSAFGSLRAVLGAEMAELKAVPGVGESTAAYLRIIGIFYARAQLKEPELPSAFSFAAFRPFLIERFEGAREEYVELYSLDGKDCVKNVRRFSSEKSFQASVDPKEISRFLVEAKPAAMVAVHNHITGPATPSREDDDFTAQLEILCSMHNVSLRDHIICSPEGVYSYFLSGKLNELSARYSIGNVLGREEK
ncbi:MAG TPA: hypothetical protein H9964_07205 [Candidatus Gallimonas intestinavium]|uniref:MPN domain-containing protein n=1 Tax=Candidatus Gallimonas intestinavium TaxID=2838603 RepID=A0A9D2G6J0_9FIRM|nr:hypothetical protein [Candidatus Gallimonas intestinavium]